MKNLPTNQPGDQYATIHYWPESQACIGCANGALVTADESQSSTYICFVNHVPEYAQAFDCSKYSESEEEEEADDE